MKAEVIKISKAFRPLKSEAILSELKNRFPEFQIAPSGNSTNRIAVKKSNFAGARLDIAEKEIRIRGDMPELLAKVVNAALLGTISAANTPNIVRSLKKFLLEKYAD